MASLALSLCFSTSFYSTTLGCTGVLPPRLILTPILYSLVTRLRLPVLPYLFACTFIADSASFLLPVSNPINILVTARFPLNLLTFLRLLFLPSLLVIGINAGVFYFLYQRQLHGRFDI